MFTQIGLLDSLTARRHHDSLSHQIKAFYAFEGSRDERSREYLTPLYDSTYSLDGGNAETVFRALKTSTVLNERPLDEDFTRTLCVIDGPDITTKPKTCHDLLPHTAVGRIGLFPNIDAQPHEMLRPIGQSSFMLCSEEWLKETEDPSELEALRPVHVDRNPSVVLEDDFRQSETDLGAVHQNESFWDFYSSSIVEDAGIGSICHEHNISAKDARKGEIFNMLREQRELRSPDADNAFRNSSSFSDKDSILRSPQTRKADYNRNVRRNTRKSGCNARRRRLHPIRNGRVRYQDVPLRYGRQSPARVQRILVEELVSTELIWNNRAKIWHDIKDSRKTNIHDLLKPELRAFLGVVVLVNGDGKPPAFRWEEATQMFSCIDEITRQTAGIPEDVLRKVISGDDPSITIDWKEMRE